MLDEDTKHICQACAWEQVPYARAQRCIKDKVLITCVGCGEEAAQKTRHTIVPMAKSNYVVVTDLEMLRGLNKYAQTEQTPHRRLVAGANKVRW